MPSVIAPKTLTEMLHNQVLISPDALAVIDEEGALSFGELWDLAQRAGTALALAGVKPGDSVGLFMAPSKRLLVAVWSILKANASYLPLAVDYPAERVSFMMTDSKIQHVIVDQDSHDAAERLAPGKVQIHQLNGAGSLLASPSNPPGGPGRTGCG
ncbi:AMP-binding protein [Arthrobacter sp. HLT1-21]